MTRTRLCSPLSPPHHPHSRRRRRGPSAPASLLFAALAVAACTGTSAGESDGTANSDTSTGEAPLAPTLLPDGTAMFFERDVRVPMRDGVHLSANVFRPVEAGTYPILLAMTPYDKDWLPVEYEVEDGDIEVSEFAGFEQPDPAFWLPRGYIIVALDCRGMGLSEGDMALLTDLEAEDYYDAIEWLATQPWSNGSVGLNGVSYMAMNQWKVAELAPPHLKAIMPWEGFTDLYRDFAYHGGIGGSAFLGGWWEERILPSKNPDSAEQTLLAGVADNPLDGPFYDGLSPQRLDSIQVPAYVVTSWPDQGLHTRGTLLGFEGISSPHRWLEVHGRKKWEFYYAPEVMARQARFFDQFLRDEPSGILDTPTVTYEVRDAYYEGETKEAESWPPPTTERTLYLDASGEAMGPELPEVASSSAYTVSGSGSERLRFTHTFAESTEITGSMNLHAWISVEGADDADLFIGLQKLDDQGATVPLHGNDVEEGQVANGWLRASHRALDPLRSTGTRPFHTHIAPQPLQAGESVELEIEIHPSSTRFLPGESIVLVIGGADMEESGLHHFGANQEGTITVYSDAERPSQLVFPVVEDR